MSALTCNCREEIEAKLQERFKATTPDATDHSVSLDGYGFGITKDNSFVTNGLMPYRAEATHTLKSGATKRKTVKGNMVFTYCPFCGVKGTTK